jgi:hypothetical protein
MLSAILQKGAAGVLVCGVSVQLEAAVLLMYATSPDDAQTPPALHTPVEQSELATHGAHVFVVRLHVRFVAAQSSLLKHSTHAPAGPQSGVGGDVDA